MRRGGATVRRHSLRALRVAGAASPLRTHVKPGFLIIGAQKAGTTSLYSWLTLHPDVLPARRKELHYFDHRIESEPIAHYWADFPSRVRVRALRLARRRHVTTGEATPYYLFHPLAPNRVFKELPDIKLIAVLRDPVERAISHWWMELERKNETLSFQEALAAEHDRIGPDLDRIRRGESPGENLQLFSYVARGRYAEQLKRWTARFPQRHLLVLQFEEMVLNPRSTFKRTLDFLGVDPDVAQVNSFEAKLPGGTMARSATFEEAATRGGPSREVLAQLREQLEEPNEQLRQLVGIDYSPRK